MKIDSVITMEVKTREEELEDLLKAGGELSEAVCRAIIKIKNEYFKFTLTWFILYNIYVTIIINLLLFHHLSLHHLINSFL